MPPDDALFLTWCDCVTESHGAHGLAYIKEKEQGRDGVVDQLSQIVRSHYDDPLNIADDIASLGYEGAAALLREELPESKTARSGDFGEIVATEYVNRQTEYQVPINRLRFKDGREMALRGDDLIGIRIVDGRLYYLKGEVKSRKAVSQPIVDAARAALKKNRGSPSKHSLNFIAKRLLDMSDASAKDLGRAIRNALIDRSIPRDQLAHMIFVLSGNDARQFLQRDLFDYQGRIRQASVCFQIRDHASCIAMIYRKALEFGDA